MAQNHNSKRSIFSSVPFRCSVAKATLSSIAGGYMAVGLGFSPTADTVVLTAFTYGGACLFKAVALENLQMTREQMENGPHKALGAAIGFAVSALVAMSAQSNAIDSIQNYIDSVRDSMSPNIVGFHQPKSPVKITSAGKRILATLNT